MQMNVMLITKIILIALLLSSCTSIRVKVATDCSWAEPLDAPDEIIDYLEAEESPESSVKFMNDIGDHNDLYEKHC